MKSLLVIFSCCFILSLENTITTSGLLFNDTILNLIDCKKALVSKDPEFIGRHIAALKYYDEYFIHEGQLEKDLKFILDKAIVKKQLNNNQILYKFPLYKELYDYTLSDEPRTNYDFYGVFFDQTNRTVKNARFFYYGTVKYRPIYKDIDECDMDSIEVYSKRINTSNDYVTVSNTILDLSYCKNPRAIEVLYKKLKKNIRQKSGHQRSLEYYDGSKESLNEWVLLESTNQKLITALSSQDAYQALPLLESLFSKSEEEIGITYENLAYFIHEISYEPIIYFSNGRQIVYPENDTLKTFIVKNKY